MGNMTYHDIIVALPLAASDKRFALMEMDLASWITPAILVAGFAWLRSDIHRAEARMNERMNERMQRLESELGEVKKELAGVKKEMAGVKKELIEVKLDLAEMKGKLTFVEGYILRRNAAAPGPAAE